MAKWRGKRRSLGKISRAGAGWWLWLPVLNEIKCINWAYQHQAEKKNEGPNFIVCTPFFVAVSSVQRCNSEYKHAYTPTLSFRKWN